MKNEQGKRAGLERRPIPVTNEIEVFMHCSKCLENMPAGVSPREWAMLEVGMTKVGIQVWCQRHELNVIHIDFQGHKHPANMSTAKTPKKGGA